MLNVLASRRCSWRLGANVWVHVGGQSEGSWYSHPGDRRWCPEQGHGVEMGGAKRQKDLREAAEREASSLGAKLNEEE